ncbi:MAG: DUF2344 domain-containing protein [Firmicutes bacterium]|nr:DUF2344 domain-containing protein [Bacillota bacterium]
MIAYRIKFEKGDDVKFISHLDVMRYFQRAIKRAALPIGYSQGFNPHQLMSFASPLTLGTTSEGEYGDFEFKEALPSKEIKDRLNAVMPVGFKVANVVRLKEKTLNSMAAVDAASYTVTFNKGITADMLKEGLKGYIKQQEIVVVKKTKKSCKEVNIREDILTLNDISANSKASLYMLLSAGSRRNLKPESVVESLCNYFNVPYEKFMVSYNRVDMYRRNEKDEIVSLDSGVGIDE